jgi:hypothetical protein
MPLVLAVYTPLFVYAASGLLSRPRLRYHVTLYRRRRPQPALLVLSVQRDILRLPQFRVLKGLRAFAEKVDVLPRATHKTFEKRGIAYKRNVCTFGEEREAAYLSRIAETPEKQPRTPLFLFNNSSYSLYLSIAFSFLSIGTGSIFLYYLFSSRLCYKPLQNVHLPI